MLFRFNSVPFSWGLVEDVPVRSFACNFTRSPNLHAKNSIINLYSKLVCKKFTRFSVNFGV